MLSVHAVALEVEMLSEIWEPQLKVVFAGTAVADPSDKLGFYHLHPRDRFWELLALGGITPQPIITRQERKALADGHAKGNLSEPIRAMFTLKKTSQLLRLGIGLSDLNRRIVATSDKDKIARPSHEDIEQFIAKCGKLQPKIVAFTMSPDIFVELFTTLSPGACKTLGLQPFTIGGSEVWLLGSTSLVLRGEALTMQEDTFFALGERISDLTDKTAQQQRSITT
jgi:G:T/U-mismatch repair DNA glycosylase